MVRMTSVDLAMSRVLFLRGIYMHIYIYGPWGPKGPWAPMSAHVYTYIYIYIYVVENLWKGLIAFILTVIGNF